MAKEKDQQETEAERAVMEVARARMDRFNRVLRPQQLRLAGQIERAAAPGSFERRRAETMAKADTGAAFAGARDKLNTGAAATGQFGGAKHKLGLVGLGQDQAISSGSSTVAADQAGDSAYVEGLGAITALGRGEKATATAGLGQAAQMSAAQARADADRALRNRMGNAQLAGMAAGVGAGLYQKAPPSADTGIEDINFNGDARGGVR